MKLKINKIFGLIVFLIIGLFINIAFSQTRPKVGLVLAGGGAKGFAHIEILKMLDSLNFPIDYIAGTSMGGILGGFYAIGYSGIEIEDIVLSRNWDEMFNDLPERQQIPYLRKYTDGQYQTSLEIKSYTPTPPSGFVAGQKIMQFFSRYTLPVNHVTNFDNFAIPFRCVAVDLISGKPITLDQGYLALAMRSTMSIPSAFAPVQWDDYLFVDGGLMNNLPVDVAKEMGADFIIAVNVGAPKMKREDLVSVVDVAMQAFFLSGYIVEEKNLKMADLVITPDIGSFSTLDFSPKSVREIISVGKQAANAFRDSLLSILKAWGIDSNHSKKQKEMKKNQIHAIESIHVIKNNFLSEKTIVELSGIIPGTIFEDVDLEKVKKELMDSNNFIYADIHSSFKSDSTVALYISVREKIEPQIHRIEVHGNKNYSFNFLYRLLNLEPGDQLDLNYIDNKINDMYALGYFRTIYYTLEPYQKNSTILHIWLEEKEKSQLNLGLHFVQEYKLVGAVGIIQNNLLLDGLRSKIDLRFAGYDKISLNISYPSLKLDQPVYPFVHAEIFDINQKLYFPDGVAYGAYDVSNSSIGAGFGALIGKSTNLEIEMGQESLKYEATIPLPGITQGDTINPMLWIRFNIDDLDNAIIPTRGMKLEINYKGQFNAGFFRGFSYHMMESMINYYVPVLPRQNLHFTGYYADTKGNPTYIQYFSTMTPLNFIGLDYYKIRYTRLLMSGIEYRIKIFKDIYFSLEGELATFIKNPFFSVNSNKLITGFGVGLTYNSVIGRMVVKFGSKEVTPYAPDKKEVWSTFFIGFPL